MKPTRIALTLLAASSLALGASACKKEKKAEGTEAAAEEGAKTVEGTATKTPTADTASATGAAAPLAHLPGDAEIIAHISFSQVRDSGLWKKYEKQIAASMNEEVGELQAACGFDPFGAIGSLTIAANTASEEKSLVVVSGIDRATIEKCAKTMSEKEGQAFTIEKEGELVRYKDADGGVLAAWIGDDQVLLATSEADAAWMTERAAGKNGLDKNAKLVALAGKANQSAAIWFAGVPTAESPMAESMGSMPTGDAPTGVYGALDFGDGFDLSIGLAYAEAAQAAKTVETLQGFVQMGKTQMPPAAKFLDKTAVTAEGNDVSIKLALTSAELDEISTLAKGMGVPFAQ